MDENNKNESNQNQENGQIKESENTNQQNNNTNIPETTEQQNEKEKVKEENQELNTNQNENIEKEENKESNPNKNENKEKEEISLLKDIDLIKQMKNNNYQDYILANNFVDFRTREEKSWKIGLIVEVKENSYIVRDVKEGNKYEIKK